MRCLVPRAAIALLLVGALALVGCPGPTPQGVDARTPASRDAGLLCVPNTTQACVCPLGVQGAQTCNAQGTGWLDCRCGPATDGSSGADRPPVADAGHPDAIGSDVARDAGSGLDRGTGDLGAGDLGASDRGSRDAGGTDGVVVGDSARTDSSGRDTAVPPADAAGRDSYRPPYDADFHPDTSGVDTSNRAGLGQSCASQACVPGTTCLGSPGAYFCRKNCTLDGTDCNPQYEHCTPWRRDDAGTYVSPGGCFPAGTLGDPCTTTNCAELYVCVAPSGTQTFLCRARCQPGGDAAVCPADSPLCWRISNMDGGSCMPRPG